MTKLLPVHKKSGIFTKSEIDQLQYTEFKTDWFGKRTTFNQNPKFSLAVDDKNFYFQAVFPEKIRINKHENAGDFIEGLWESDVVEFFICEQNSTRYQEFNLSPAGAWWSCLFSEYRKRNKTQPIKQTSTITSTFTTDECRGVLLETKLDELAINFALNVASKINVNFILNGNIYLSWAEYKGIEPDFHLVQGYYDAKIIRC